MDRLSQQAISELSEAFLHAGTTDVRDMENLTNILTLLRSRVRACLSQTDAAEQRTNLARCITPLVQWMMGEPDLAQLTAIERSDLLWNIYTAALSRTAGAEAFDQITGDERAWQEMSAELFQRMAPTSGHSGQPTSMVTQRSFPWHLYMIVIGLSTLLLDQWLLSGRMRFYATALGTLLVGGGVLLSFWPGDSPVTDGRTMPVVHASGSGSSRRVLTQEGVGQNNVDALHTSHVPSSLPPMAAPPLPSSSSPPVTTPIQQGQPLALSVGTSVLLNGTGVTQGMSGQKGTVVVIDGQSCEVQLSSGLRIGPISTSCKTRVPDEGEVQYQELSAGSSQVYAPLANNESLGRQQKQATRVREALDKTSGMQSTLASWSGLFWQSIKNEKDLYGLDPHLKTILEIHGYQGDLTQGPPPVEELRKQLQEVETKGGPLHGSAGLAVQFNDGVTASDPEQMAWHLRLPPDLQRAGPELYRNIRAEGVSSVRQWVNEQHPGTEQKNTAQYQDLFTAATIVDFEVAGCRTESMLMHKLATSDSLEIHLRKLGAFIYYRRTKDKTGANRMLGIRAPGTNSDIAPKWMLDDANTFAKTEYQRIERGQKMNRWDGPGPKTDGGKGKRGGGKSGGRGGRPTPKPKGGATTQG